MDGHIESLLKPKGPGDQEVQNENEKDEVEPIRWKSFPAPVLQPLRQKLFSTANLRFQSFLSHQAVYHHLGRPFSCAKNDCVELLFQTTFLWEPTLSQLEQNFRKKPYHNSILSDMETSALVQRPIVPLGLTMSQPHVTSLEPVFGKVCV